MSRVIWKGHVSFGLVQIPVNLHPATQDDDLDFTLLDKRNMSPIGYRKVNKSTGEEVPGDEIVRGYAWEEGEYVLVTDEELKAANPAATQSIDIVAFVDGDQLDPRWFVRPYYVAPTKRSAKAYALLRETMRRTGKIGIAKVVLRTRQYVAALMVRGDILVLELLRYAAEVRGTQEFDLPGRDVEVGEKELKMAELLVQTLATDWDPSQYEDEYRKDVLALIEQKARTGVTAPRRAVEEGEEAGEVVDIAALLKKSVEAHAKPRKKKVEA
ncbi:MAG: Ku protein [Myxococcota bacterium]